MDLIITVVLAIVGWVMAAFFGVRFVKRRKPVWAYRTIPIIGINSRTPPEFKLFYNDRSVEAAYRTLAIFFNAGNQTIEASDIRKQITLVFENSKILREPNVNARDPDTGFSAAWSTGAERSEVKLDFKCLEHNDGAVIEVIHDGKGRGSCDGRIKETKEIAFLGSFSPPDPRKSPPSLIGGFVASLVFLVVLVWAVMSGANQLTGEPVDAFMTGLLFAVFGLMFWQNVDTLLKRRRFPVWSGISG